MSELTYECPVCHRSSDAPLDMKVCPRCGNFFCAACLPDHEAVCGKQQPMVTDPELGL